MEENKRNEGPPAPTAPGDEYDYSSTHEKMNNSSVDVNKINDIEWKKNKVLELDSKGYTQQEIAEAVGISQPTVSRYLKEAQESIVKSRRDYVIQRVRELERTRFGNDRALKGVWSIADDPTASHSDKLRAYSLIILGNSRKNQATTVSHALSKWLDSVEDAQKQKERDSTSLTHKLQRYL